MNEKLDILQMLQDGTISVDEASKLLEAVAAPDTDRPDTAPPGQSPAPSSVPPDLGRFRRLSTIPFALSLLLLILTGWGAYALYARTEGRITFWFVVLVVLLVLAFLSTALSLWATTVPWLHVRIRSAPNVDSSGTRIAISLPVPLTLAGWGLKIVHRFVDPDAAGHLQAAAALVSAMSQDLGKPGAEPIVVDVDDEDERVQVYIG